MTPVLRRIWRLVPIVVYCSSPLPAATVFGTFATYGVISIVWGFEGRRPLDVDSVFVPSTGWPPFVMPAALWVVFALVGLLAVAEILTGGRKSLLRQRSGLIAYAWGAGAVSSATYSIGFLGGLTWTSPAAWATVTMALASTTAAAIFVLRLLARARPGARRLQRGLR